MDGIDDRIVAIIARQAMLDRAAVTPDAALDDLGLDSLALVELIFQLEETFDISIPFNASEPAPDGPGFGTVADLTAAVRTLIGEGG